MYNGSGKNSLARVDLVNNYDPVANMSVEPANLNQERGKGLNINRYATKKTIAQGMMDIALMTANASQLRYILSLGDKHQFYTLMLSLIIISLILQVIIGLLSLSMSMLRDCQLEKEDYAKSTELIGQFNVGMVSLVATINVVMNGIGVQVLPERQTNESKS